MGLDSHIYKKKVLTDNWAQTIENDLKHERLIKENEVLYLRKANQIHHYIVEKFNHGIDDQTEIPLEIDDIKELMEICSKIMSRCRRDTRITNKRFAKKLLPTKRGYFFGSTDYGRYYWDCVESFWKQAIEIIEDYNREIEKGTSDLDISYYYIASY